jgi:type III secretion system YscQ/HrcQ family protein
VLGERVSVADASGAQLPPAANVLRIRFAPLHAVAGAVPLQAHVALADADWLHVAETVSRAGARRRMGNGTRLPLTLRIVLTGAALARSELARLKPGDMIRVAGDEAPGGKLRRVSLRLGQTDLFACRVQPAGLTIETASSLDARRTSMSNDAALKRLDQLEVPVSFQFGTLPVSLEQLGSIGPGHTFTTSLPTEQPVVSIIVDGQKLGTGRLIAVGELVGVQVIDWVQGD